MPELTPNREAADFYIGRGPDAEFLGCLTYNGDPDKLDAFGLFQSITGHDFDDAEFRAEVADLSAIHCDWVHEWDSSRWTPWTYMYDSGTVFVYHFGVEMAQLRCNFTRRAPRRVKNADDSYTTFPDEWVRIPRDTARHTFPTMRKATSHAH